MAHRPETDVVVVGAGTSGCYLAWRLAQAGVRVLVLEKSDQPGGCLNSWDKIYRELWVLDRWQPV